MVFRLPSHLESFVPPPYEQRPQPGPWRGTITVSGMRSSDRSSNQEIRVTAVETDGENRQQQWPPQFFVQTTHERPILRDVQAWVKQHNTALCTFMPDRLRDSNANMVNQANFRSLSRILFESQTVAIAPWGVDAAFPGGGIIIYPAQNTSALLVGALFLYTPFPDFVLGVASPTMSQPSSMIHQSHTHLSQTIVPISSPYGSPTHGHHSHSRSPRSHPSSPIEQPMPSGHRQDSFRYIMPRTTPYPNPTPSSSSSTDAPIWPVKAEDSNRYNTFSAQQNPPYP